MKTSPIPRDATIDAPEPPAGEAICDRIAKMAAELPDDVIDGLPTDGATNHDHYLYGAPKTGTPPPAELLAKPPRTADGNPTVPDGRPE